MASWGDSSILEDMDPSEVDCVLKRSASSVFCPSEVPSPAVNTKCGAPCGIFPPGDIVSMAFCRSAGVNSSREFNHVSHVLPSTSCSSTKRLEIVSERVVDSPLSFAKKVVMRLSFSRLREFRSTTPFSNNLWVCLEKNKRSSCVTSCGADAITNNNPKWMRDCQSVA